MQITNKQTYTLINSDENSVVDFYQAFSDNIKTLENQHLILALSDNLTATSKEISLFLNISKSQKEKGFSFVLVQKEVDIDDFPDDFNIVPTLAEAEDVLEMEAIERDLGF